MSRDSKYSEGKLNSKRVRINKKVLLGRKGPSGVVTLYRK